VYSIRDAAGKTCAELCVGKRATRLNLKAIPAKGKLPKGIELSGHSESWAGGGVVVNEGNVKLVRALLAAITKVAAPAKPAPRPEAAPATDDAAVIS